MKKNFSKILISSFLATSLFLSNVYGFDKTNVSITIDELIQPISSNVINKDGYTLISFRDLFDMLDADIDWNDYKRTITAQKDDKILIINVDTNEVTLNGSNVDMPVDVEIVDGYTYIPLRFICEIFGMQVDWEEENKKISIDTGNDGYIFLNSSKDDGETIAYEDAIEKAISNNTSIKNMEDTLNYAEKLQKDLKDQLYGLNFLDSTGESVLKSLEELNFQVDNNDINKQIIEDGVELSVISAVISIESIKLNIQVLEKTIEVETLNVKNLELKFEYGMTSEKSLQDAKDSLSNSKTSLETLKLSLKSQQNALNSILGEKSDINVSVDLGIDFSIIDKIDLDIYINQKVEGDISIQILNEEIKKAENIKKYYSFNSTDDEVLKMQNDINSLKRKLSDTKSDMEKKIKDSYNNLLKAKYTDEDLKISLDKAITEYNNIVVNYINGKSTLYNIEQAKLNILNVEKQIEDNKINFFILLYTFSKPYLL